MEEWGSGGVGGARGKEFGRKEQIPGKKTQTPGAVEGPGVAASVVLRVENPRLSSTWALVPLPSGWVRDLCWLPWLSSPTTLASGCYVLAPISVSPPAWGSTGAGPQGTQYHL